MTSEQVSQKTHVALKDLAHKLRIDSIRMIDVTSSGHPTSCSSIAEIISVLFFNEMRYSVSEPLHPSNDRIVLSKGHTAPILYAAWAEAGLFPKSELMKLRLMGCDLEGHPTPRLNFIDVATGSLGQGIGVAAGMAYDGLYINKSKYRVYCILGDGECMEGSVWEAAAFAGLYKLHNLVAIVDVNKLGQSDYTSLKHDMEAYRMRFESFGFGVAVIQGQNIDEVLMAFKKAKEYTKGPFAILSQALKGAHFPDIEGKENWHGKALGLESKRVIAHLEGLIVDSTVNGASLRGFSQQPVVDLAISRYPAVTLSEPPNYEMGKEFATRLACGVALAKIGKSCNQIVVCDGDVKNSTYTDKFKAVYPDRFVDCYIAEQNLVSVATGLGCRCSHIPFLSTFAAFLSRAHDQIRMAAISYSQLKIIGTHCGVSIGEDGGSQMGLEDLAMFRCLPNSVVLYPSDSVSAERAVELAANARNLVYIRSSRPAMPTIYKNDEPFAIGQSKVVLKSDQDKILVIGAGVTLIESLKAAQELKKKGVGVRVVDIFSVKPIDKECLAKNALECGNLILTIEDHYVEGGIGEAVSSCLAEYGKYIVHKVYVNDLPRSGKPREVMEMFGLTSEKIAEKLCTILKC